MSMLSAHARRVIRGHPELSLLDFDVGRTIVDVRREFPTLAPRQIEVWLQAQSTLSCITDEGESTCIRLHPVLNHSGTPRAVIKFILCHELIHLLVPPREVDGKRKTHSPEFWAAERKRCPNRIVAWSWIITVLGPCLRSDRRKECIFVKRNWKLLMHERRPTLEQISSNVSVFNPQRFENSAVGPHPLRRRMGRGAPGR